MSMYKYIHKEFYKRNRGVKCIPVDPLFECTICFGQGSDPCKPKRYVKQLQCGHKFHVKCINIWLHGHVNCPLCRYNMYRRYPLPTNFLWVTDLVDSTYVNLEFD